MTNMKMLSCILYFMLLYFLLIQFSYSSEPHLNPYFESSANTDDGLEIHIISSSYTNVEEEKNDDAVDEAVDNVVDNVVDDVNTDVDDNDDGDNSFNGDDGAIADDDDTGDSSQTVDKKKTETKYVEKESNRKEDEKSQQQIVLCDDDNNDDVMCKIPFTTSERREFEQDRESRYTQPKDNQNQKLLEQALQGEHSEVLQKTEGRESGRSDELLYVDSFISNLKSIILNNMKMNRHYFTDKVCLVLETTQLNFQKYIHDLNVDMMKTIKSLKIVIEEKLKIIDEHEHTRLANFAYLVHSINFDRPKSKCFKKILDSVFEHASSIKTTNIRLASPFIDQLSQFMQRMENHLIQIDSLLHELQVFFSAFNYTLYRMLHTPFVATNSVNRNKRMERLIRSLNRLVRVGNSSKILHNRKEYKELLITISSRLEYFIRIAHFEVMKGKLELAKLLKKTNLKDHDLELQTLEFFFSNLKDSNIQAKQKLLAYMFDLQEKGQLSSEHTKLMELVNEDERIIGEKYQKVVELYKMKHDKTLQGETSSSEKTQTSFDQRIVNDIAKCFMKFSASERALSVLKPVEQIIKKILKENSTITSDESRRDKEDETSSKEKKGKEKLGSGMKMLMTEELQQIKTLISNMQQNFQNMISIERFIYSLEKKKKDLNNMKKDIKQSLYFLNLIKKNYKMLDEMKPLNMEDNEVVKLIKQILAFMYYAINTFV